MGRTGLSRKELSRVEAMGRVKAHSLRLREAAELLKTLAGVHVGSKTLRTHAERVGTEIEGRQQRAMAHVQAHQELSPESSHAPAPGVLVVEADGVMVRYRDVGRDGSPWHEVKLGIVGGWTGARPEAHLEAPSYVAAREKAAPVARRLGAEAAQRGALEVVGWRGRAADGGGQAAILRSVVVIGDGAKWIWDEVAASFGGERTEIVDWWHAATHLWDLSKVLHGEGTPQATAWAEHAKHLLWRHGPVPLLVLLRETIALTDDALKVLHRERGYFTTNALRDAVSPVPSAGPAGRQRRRRRWRQALGSTASETGRDALE